MLLKVVTYSIDKFIYNRYHINIRFYRKEASIINIKKIFPGLILCIFIAIISKILGVYVPSLGAATISIFLGIFLGNTIAKSTIFHCGTKFSEGTLLSISVVLLGATLSIKNILHIGFKGLLFIIIQMLLTIAFVIIIGKKMKFSTDFTLLMASGNSVCGSSAIASCAPVIGANNKDKGISITMVNISGTALMLIIPIITTILYKNEIVKSSALIGGILQSVGQVVASGSIISEDVKELATIFKIVRIIFLVGVIIILGIIKEHSLSAGFEDFENINKKEKSRLKMPWYIKGFFILCFLYSVGAIPQILSKHIKNIDNFIEIIALAGIGMNVSIVDLLKQGLKTSLFCTFIGIAQIIFAISLIYFLF